MQILTIQKDISLEDIEQQYRHLTRLREFDATVNLMIPKKLENNFLGLVPALLQFVITWVRYPTPGKLLLSITNPETENWGELLEAEHLYPIIGLVINKTGVYDAKGEIHLNKYLREPFSKVRLDMLRVNPLKGGKLLLTSIDHFPISYGLLPCFETPEDFIDNESSISRNLKPALDYILRYSQETQNNYQPFEKDFVAIIHELMKNTYEWGKTDVHNVAVDPSIRGILVKFYRRKRDAFKKEFLFHEGVLDYFSNKKLKENGIYELYFLEISVYDSGIGFVNKFRSKNSDKLSDVDIIKRCLIKHRTSATGLEKDEKGIGLDRILGILDNKGFIRIKTNKSCLYRNLISHPYKKVENERDMDLFDWETKSTNSYTTFPNAEGSTLTILYPLAINV